MTPAHSMQTQSYWMDSQTIPGHSPLAADCYADVCVVGAGIAGLTTAYLLLRDGKSVVVLDASLIGSGQTERTTAHLSNAIDDRFVNIEHWHGKEGARLAAESHGAAIDQIDEIISREQISCDFERLEGYLFAPPADSSNIIQLEFAATQRAGMAHVELVPRAPFQVFETGAALRFPRQAQFHPLKYLAGLVRAIERMGGRICTETRVEKIISGPPTQVRTKSGFTVTTTSAVAATNVPFNDWVTIHTKQAPYLSYVAGYTVPCGAVAKALYWDTEHPYHYARVQRLTPDQSSGEPESEELLIVGGEDHKTGQADDANERYRRLDAWTHERFPMAGDRRYQWSGQVMETVDGLAFIGRNPLDGTNIYIATGDSGQGMTHGTIAGMLISDLIADRDNPWQKLYDPARKTLMAAGRFLQENVNVGLQFGTWLTGGDVSSADEIASSEGAILRRGMKKVAAYRDEQGTLHECSAVCPHLGCIVDWNHNDNTWDCPCHGSRFDGYGKMLNGPAISDLTLEG
jgi:glycine/D-amino acid oxidase-like deaminating enzyme/nitrite reductase/ring-hydroxylating ferredoxin subunit